MKRIVIYALLMVTALVLPIQGVDVGKLLPVELVQIYKEEDTVVITTDVGAAGTGLTVKSAVENLKATTSGIIFLDTADYLLIDETAQEEALELAKYLKPFVRVCDAAIDVDLRDAAMFLGVHKPKARLKDQQGQYKTEILTIENGRMILKEN